MNPAYPRIIFFIFLFTFSTSFGFQGTLIQRRSVIRAQSKSEQAAKSNSDGGPRFAGAMRTSKTAEALEDGSSSAFRQQKSLFRRAQPPTSPALQPHEHTSPTLKRSISSARFLLFATLFVGLFGKVERKLHLAVVHLMLMARMQEEV